MTESGYFFESNYRDFAENPLERDALLRDTNFRSLAALGHQCSNELPRAWPLRANFASGNTSCEFASKLLTISFGRKVPARRKRNFCEVFDK